jgi:hypothetical protein
MLTPAAAESKRPKMSAGFRREWLKTRLNVTVGVRGTSIIVGINNAVSSENRLAFR